MRRILLIMLCLFALPVMGSHIVGGEFQLIHLSGTRYRLDLIYYFDVNNNTFNGKPPESQEPTIRATIYKKSNNSFVRSIILSFTSKSRVLYTQPTCSNGEIVTDKLIYSTEINMLETEFGDIGGYYVSWQRCCRNYTITNIYSQNPNTFGTSAGQTFYLEFPPVVKDGKPFINSSPRLFPPLNDYACPYKAYYVDFAGVDDDDDSLVYTLVTPLSTHTFDALPVQQSGPYPEVTWRNPFSIKNIIAGIPDLKISIDGFLTATPTKQGLYVFAVKCEEFRDGVRIGQVIRDFQMLVVDKCPQAEPPKILGRKLTETNFTYDGDMNITFSNTVVDANRCIEVQVSDPDASKPGDGFSENVKIKAIALSFKKDIQGILPEITSTTLVNGSKVNFQICFDQCPYVEGPFQIGIVAYDDACSLPLSDTLKITVNIQPPANNNVRFTAPSPALVSQTLNEGDKMVWDIVAIDDDGDQIIAAIFTDGFNPADVGMTFTQIKNENGDYQARLEWDTRCNVYDFTKKTEFEFKIQLEDVDFCKFSHPAYRTFKLKVKLPGNQDPIIESNLPGANRRLIGDVTRKVNESLNFNVFGVDGDNDFLILGVKGKGFDLSTYNISFPGDQKNGNVFSPFNWNIACDKVNLNVKDEFEFEFIVMDNANKCRFYKADTLNVIVKLEPPDNSKPNLHITSTSQTVPLNGDSVSIFLGEQISLSLIGTDADINPAKDKVRIKLIEAIGNVVPTGYNFEPAEGNGIANTTFVWKPDCSIFENNIYKNEYAFTFRVFDDKCFNDKGDTLKIAVTVRDVDGTDKDFIPPNFITPNGDNLNDFFAMVKLDEETHELVSILPKDNCIGRFIDIKIFNRWGAKVFSSNNRDFKWYADGESGGVYFYLLTYSDKEYKGLISVLD